MSAVVSRTALAARLTFVTCAPNACPTSVASKRSERCWRASQSINRNPVNHGAIIGPMNRVDVFLHGPGDDLIMQRDHAKVIFHNALSLMNHGGSL